MKIKMAMVGSKVNNHAPYPFSAISTRHESQQFTGSKIITEDAKGFEGNMRRSLLDFRLLCC
jgi:hypothetical protein